MNTNIDQIIYLNLSGSANKKEQEILNEWVNASAKNRNTYHLLKVNWGERTKEPILINEDEIFEKVWKEAVETKSKKVFISTSIIMKMAASLLIIFTLWYLVMFVVDKPEEQLAEVNTINKVNPAGQKSKLFLSDGTIVWLNAKSSIQYLESFTDSSRIVHLEGEAYFEVTKDKTRPFIVITNDITTEALGTAFNINSFNEQSEININLVSGKVNVSSDGKSFLLNPGQAISVNRRTSATKRYEFNIEDLTAWKDGILIFEKASIDEVIHRLERWYGIKIKITGPKPKSWQISGRFDNKHLTEILELIQYTREFKFDLKSKNLNIIFN